jgi:ABC-type sugar transport system permease subunit
MAKKKITGTALVYDQKSTMRKTLKRNIGFFFVLPWLVGLLIFKLYPFASSLFYSFTDYQLFDGINKVGLMNYKEIFESEKNIVDYNHLGIGRLIYQLPTTLCRLFLNEVFREGVFETIDSETMITIQKFFENNLNVSETSRQLFIHRNTLVYRLDKIQKITGMDLRKFDDAIYFKVAMMVKRYLDEVSK